MILAEENPNDWIEKIDKSWTGRITFYIGNQSEFRQKKIYQGELKEGDLEKLIQEVSK